jgi:2'-5' RNA ligase
VQKDNKQLEGGPQMGLVTTSHFNLALYPQEAKLASACVELAQTNFKEQASEYLLGENAHPHVTLCQFQTSEDQMESIWSEVEKLGREAELLALRFHHFYIKPGFHFHQDKYWLGLAVSATPELLAMQKALHTLLAQMNIESPTQPQSYFPHLTLARCHTLDYANPPQLKELPALDIWQQDFVFQVTLGRSNEYGVYLERLMPVKT